MAKKSKTQKAKASAARAQRKQMRDAEASAATSEVKVAEAEQEQPKRSLFKKKETPSEVKPEKKAEKKAEAKPAKKNRFQFFRDVKSEMKRVTWPTKQDVLRWSVVVVAALLFFGVYVALLDNVIVTPLLVAVSGLGA